MLPFRVSLPLVIALATTCACESRKPAATPAPEVAVQKPTRSPGVSQASPASVTRSHPGGDAKDPHYAALLRQKDAPWGWKADKDRQAHFPLPDRKHWTRIRFFGVDHFTAFKYGDKEHAVSAAFVVELKPEDPPTSAACVQRFEEQAMPKVSEFGGKVTNITTGVSGWNRKPLVVRQGTGAVNLMFKHYDAALAWTGYPAYEGACLIYSVAVPWHGHKELAESVRNAWAENFRRFVPLTKTVPFRR